MKKIIAFFSAFVLLCVGVGVKSLVKKETIVIYTSMEDYTMELMEERFSEQFPKYNVVIEYMSTSNIATKVIEEGDKCEADIVYGLEYAYLENIIANGRAANLRGEYDMTKFEDDMVQPPMNEYVIPSVRTGSSVIVNNKVLKDKNLPKPTSYADLLKPEYENLISMPSPKASSTGYAFYLALVNMMGEEAALEYFDDFAKNVIAFTSSGSGPVNALVAREAAIGLGMISQAVEKISSGITELEVLTFEKGVPFALYGTIVVKGKESNSAVMEVVDYMYNSLVNEICEKFYPEPIFKDVRYEVKNFPPNIGDYYANMSGNTIERKEDLLRKWKY